jgi:lysophospholipid acyltransferase (LPLAT)-like uncharacterized protein
VSIKVDKRTRRGRFVLSLAAWLGRMLIGLLGATWRLEVEGKETLAAVLAENKPQILSFWHNRTVIAAYFLSRHLLRQGLGITLLASQSRDGELITRLVAGWGVETVRGSATRGGREALRGIYKAITQKGSSPLVVPDGPQGPLYVFKAGAAVLAQMSGAPILPMGFAARSSWRLKSWDKLIVPRPFAKVVVVVGEPQYLAKELAGEAFEQERMRLEALLAELTNRAEAAAA